MSLALCTHCDGPVDTDDDPGCFVEFGNMRRQTKTEIVCETCREWLMERQDEQMAASETAQ